MSLLTINKLTDIGRCRGDRASTPTRLAADDAAGRRRPRRAGRQWRAGVSGLGARSRGAGGVLPAARRDRPLLGRAPSGRRHLPGDAGQVEELLGGLPAGDVRLAHRRLHTDRTTSARRRRPCCRPSRSPIAAARPSSPTPMPPTTRSATRRSSGSGHCGWCTRWRHRSAGSTPTRRRSWWRGGGPVPPTSIRWCGRTAAAAGRWCSARRRTTSSAWILGEGRALLAELLDRATQPDLVYSHEWSVGDTVIWDNNGVLHRAAPYDPDSPREMLRTTVLGDEPIQ